MQSNESNIHAFGANVALFAGFTQLYAITQGNAVIFECMSKFADRIELNATVTQILKRPQGFVVEYYNHGPLYEIFDHVIVAVPQPSSIHFEGFASKSPQDIPYVTVYTTIVVGLPSLNYFNLNSYEDFPESILIPDSSTSPFNSFSVKEWINYTTSEDMSALVKLFSPARLTEDQLDEIFASRTQTIIKAWKAYPYLTPKNEHWQAPVVLDNSGVYYVNRMEEWISTMETETIAGRNAANLLLSKWANV